MENTCRVQLLAERAATSGTERGVIPDKEAEYTYQHWTPEAIWKEFQPDYEYEHAVSGGAF